MFLLNAPRVALKILWHKTQNAALFD